MQDTYDQFLLLFGRLPCPVKGPDACVRVRSRRTFRLVTQHGGNEGCDAKLVRRPAVCRVEARAIAACPSPITDGVPSPTGSPFPGTDRLQLNGDFSRSCG